MYDGENYTEIIENSFVNTLEKPDSYFSIDVNTASYPNLRRYIEQGNINFDKNAVRVEEMLNYFDYEYETPTDGSVLALTSSVFDTPYNENTKLMTIGLAAQEIEFKQIQNNIVFLIDVSGSMNSADKLPLVQQAFSMLAENLNDNDRVSIVTYAGSDKVVLDVIKLCEVVHRLVDIDHNTLGHKRRELTSCSLNLVDILRLDREHLVEAIAILPATYIEALRVDLLVVLANRRHSK
jgi:hypothetical protein